MTKDNKKMNTFSNIFRILEENGVFVESKDNDVNEEFYDYRHNHNDYDFYQVDWGCLINGSDNNEQPIILHDEKLLNPIYDALEDESVAISQEDFQRDCWDTCAWYQSIHIHGPLWGIFIREECIIQLSVKIAKMFKNKFPVPISKYKKKLLVEDFVKLSFLAYYFHELYHHKTESFAIKLLVTNQKNFYTEYFYNIYEQLAGTDEQLEEALANAYTYRNLSRKEYKKINPRACESLQKYLMLSFPHNPPGYRKAPDYLQDDSFKYGEHTLFSQLYECSLTPKRNINDWLAAPRLNQSLSNIRTNIWSVVPKGSHSLIPHHSSHCKTCSTKEFIKICKKHHFTEHKVRGKKQGKGSHIKMKNPEGACITISHGVDNLQPFEIKNSLEVIGPYKLKDLPELLEKYS